MESIFSLLFDGSGIPHGYCIAWDPRLIWIMVVSNAMIAFAYFSIPFALARFLRLQRGLPFGWMFVLFSGFIFSCGLTHVIDIVNLYRPAYRLDAVMMAITAVISLATAAALFPLVPTASAYLTRNKQRDTALRFLNDELQDATAQLAERNTALEASEQRFRLTLQGAPIGLAIVSIEGRFLEVNEALCKILDYTAAELQQLSFQQITHPEDLSQDVALLQNLLAGKAQNYRMEKRYFAKSGRTLVAQLDVTLLRSSDGKPQHFISQIQDITDRRALEEALRRSATEGRVLMELDGTLQACQLLLEIGPPTSKACVAVYPDSSGAIYIRNASKSALERIHSWGETDLTESAFSADACWALRRGEPLVQCSTMTTPACASTSSKATACTTACACRCSRRARSWDYCTCSGPKPTPAKILTVPSKSRSARPWPLPICSCGKSSCGSPSSTRSPGSTTAGISKNR